MLIDAQNLPLVAMDFMNTTHFEDVEIINRLYKALENYIKNSNEVNAKKVSDVYTEWFEHTIEHFKTPDKIFAVR